MDKVILVGGFHEIIELCENSNIEILGIIDNSKENFYCGYPILGKDADAVNLYKEYGKIPLVISPDKPTVREKLVDFYKKIGYNFYTLIGKNAVISKTAQLGIGCIIQGGVNVSSFAKIGNFVKLNTNANIMHDVTMHDFSTAAPNSVLLGHVIVNNKAYIGANATILPTIEIGEGAIVGAGAVVTKNVKAGETVIGSPAKTLSK